MKPDYYDIKGNTFKDTLIPSDTVTSAQQNAFNNTFTEGFQASVPRVKPVDKRGYKRSGMIFFGNINHIPADQTTNANSSIQKTRNDTFKQTSRYKDNATTEPSSYSNTIT